MNINFNQQEIEALQICITETRMHLEESVAYLHGHNKSGINTKLIKKKAERINDLDALWDKLYMAEKLMRD